MRVRHLAGLVLASLFVLEPAPGSAFGAQDQESLRAALERAVAAEKAHPTKAAALAADAALEALNRSRMPATQVIPEPAVHRRPIGILAGPSGDPEVEPNDTSGTANVLPLTGGYSVVTGAISPGGDLDFFTFTAPAGSRAWIETDTGGTQNGGATSRDTIIDLLASDGSTVIENDDDDGTGNGRDGTVETGLASMIGGRTLVAGGTYFIRVRAFSAGGIVDPYRLTVVVTNFAAVPEVEANNTAATANAIATPFGIRSGSIGAAGDADYYSFTASAGNVIYFNTDADPERDGTGTDLVVELRDAADVLLLSVDSSITGSLANPAAEGADFLVVTGGTYYVKVRHFSASGTGTYDLMVGVLSQGALVLGSETEPNDTSGTANALDLSTNYTIVSGAINPGGDLDFFTFTAPAGSRIWIETDTGGTQNGGATSRDTVIDLLASDGSTVIENDDDDGTGNGGDGTTETGLASMIGGRTLTAGGTYFIRVRAFSATGIINPYRLLVALTNFAATPEVEANNTAATANPIGTPIGIRSGSIGVAGDADYYSFPAQAGDVAYFNVDADPERDGTGTDLVVELRDPADVLLLSVDSSITGSLANPAAEGANFSILSSGTYFIRVRHFSASGTGTYDLMVAVGSQGAAPPCVLTCPANVTQANDPNQCGAVVNYPAPTTSGPCGTVNASPASGSFFPVGTTNVTATSTAGPTCNFTVTVNDTQPPTVIVPPNQFVNGTGPTVVNYPPATVSDNCPGVSPVMCVPASGLTFPVGTTTVTCTATDAANNTSSPTFTVTVALIADVPMLSWPVMLGLGVLLAAIGALLLRNRTA